MSSRSVGILALLACALAEQPARAHAIGATARLGPDGIRVEAYFADNQPVRAARVLLQDAVGGSMAEGRTDAQGRCLLPRPAAGRYRLIVEDDTGHKSRVMITVPADTIPRPASESPEPLISEGDDREAFTHFPWRAVSGGLGLIVLGSLAWIGWLRRQRALAQKS